MMHPRYTKAGQRLEAEAVLRDTLSPAQEIAAIAAPYMPHDKWVELYAAIDKALAHAPKATP